MKFCRPIVATLLVTCFSSQCVAQSFTLNPGDHISIIGNTTADRMQHHGWLETYLHALHPEYRLSFRNLALAGDELKVRPREDNFGSPDEWLTKTKADVVFCFFGYNEALKGPEAIDGFRKDLSETIRAMKSQKYNGQSAPKLVFFSPIGHENLNDRHLPDGSANNANLGEYTKAMQSICETQGVAFVDLFKPTIELYTAADTPLTLNGVHLLESGNRKLATVICRSLFGKIPKTTESELERLRQAILVKNDYWFNRYRVVDGYNVFGGRSKLAWFGQSNADVMMREMEIFDIMTANREARVHAVAAGGDLEINDANIPDELVVKTNKKGDQSDGGFSYLNAEQSRNALNMHEGLEANVYASEEMFPELVNPVQMAVDTDSRLFVSVWPSYPHWNPTEPRADRILCLPDDNGDGVADRCVVFADDLNSVTGFEFWNGGMIVAALPELWFLKDTNGDDVADVRIRMLQGLSSADSHHSANAMVMGPDGWIYWSRGIFNVASMETPTRTYRSGRSGVHRFNPRTFEMEFHFPIGPNPHGDVFDQWGFQFANDGTSGTGSYVNIGKGVGNKQWFKKRVRPVAATGILSGEHFPDELQNHFLICNCIGFLGVLNHQVQYNGADISAKEVAPILVSDDPNFRPTDLEIGGDGALYVSDWANALIGHMQHNMRDPNRDKNHGRIFRITAKGRPLSNPLKLKNKPIAEVCKAFFSKANADRYRARIELSSRDDDDIEREVLSFAHQLDVHQPGDAQALLECLWVFEERRLPQPDLLATVFQAAEPRVRSAAIRTLGHWSDEVPGWQNLIMTAAKDTSALVRAEAVKAAVAFSSDETSSGQNVAAETLFEVGAGELDPELDTVLKWAKSKIDIDNAIQQTMTNGGQLSPAAYRYALKNSAVSDLLKLERTPELYQAVLNRTDLNQRELLEAATGFATLRNLSTAQLLTQLFAARDAENDDTTLNILGAAIISRPRSELKKVGAEIEKLALNAKTETAQEWAFAAWVTMEQNGADALYAASRSKDSLKRFLAGVPDIPATIRSTLYEDVRSLMFELPAGLAPESTNGGVLQPGIQVEYFYPNAKDVAMETLDGLTPKEVGVVPEIVMNVPQRKQNDTFALRFAGNITVSKPGRYSFAIASDDGSRIYLNNQLLVNNDGLHGMVEKSASIQLTAGQYPFVVTYFDNGGGDGLKVTWAGPGFSKQPISADVLSVTSGVETIHDLAIRSLAAIPGNEVELFHDLADLLKAGRSQPACIEVLSRIDQKHWQTERVPEVTNNMIGFLTTLPARQRTSAFGQLVALTATKFAESLSESAAADAMRRLQNLDVRVIAIGTVAARMIYDKEKIVVEAGKDVEFQISNTDHMPHNFAIVRPGTLAEVGELAEKTARNADAKQRHFVPAVDAVLLSSRLLEPGQSQALPFKAPAEPGIYPYVCTYPGHWRRMFGAMYVVDNIDEYTANPVEYLAAHPLEFQDDLLARLNRNTEWKVADLAQDASDIWSRENNFEVGNQLFTVATCIGCHQVNGKGVDVGPSVKKLNPRWSPEEILTHILEPSKKVDTKYVSNIFVMDSGKIVTGMIVREDASTVKVIDNPTAPDKVRVLRKDEIDDRTASKLSLMPAGLLNKLTREEVLDLLAFVVARGDKESEIYETAP